MPCVVPNKYVRENRKSFLPDTFVQGKSYFPPTFLKWYLRTFQNMYYI